MHFREGQYSGVCIEGSYCTGESVNRGEVACIMRFVQSGRGLYREWSLYSSPSPSDLKDKHLSPQPFSANAGDDNL